MLTQFADVTNTALTATSGTSQDISEVPCTYHGIVLCETAGAVAHVRVYDNQDADSGALLDSIKLVSGESVGTWYERGITAADGLRVDVVSGTVEGAVRHSRAV